MSEVVVVLGHRSDEIAEALQDEGVKLVRNPRYLEGMLTSIQAGVETAPADAEWLVVALGDQPWVRPELVALLLDEAAAALREGRSIVAPSYGGRRGHPLVIHRRHRPEIGELNPEIGLRELLQRHGEAIRHVVVPEESVLRDLDTPEDYRREMERMGTSGGASAI